MKNQPHCPHCGQMSIKYGAFKSLKDETTQRFLCKSCGKFFSKYTGTIFHRANFKPEPIAVAVEFLLQIGLSLNQTKLVLKRFFKAEVGRSTLSLWKRKFANCEIELPESEYSDVWYVDELFVKHEKRFENGTKEKWFDYVWAVCDENQNLLALHLSKHRDLKAAVEVLRKAKVRAGFNPRVVISDGLQSYRKAVRKVFGRKTKHIPAGIKKQEFLWLGEFWSVTTNIVESLNSRLRDRLRRIRGYKNFACGETFLKCLLMVWNSRLKVNLAGALLKSVNC